MLLRTCLRAGLLGLTLMGTLAFTPTTPLETPSAEGEVSNWALDDPQCARCIGAGFKFHPDSGFSVPTHIFAEGSGGEAECVRFSTSDGDEVVDEEDEEISSVNEHKQLRAWGACTDVHSTFNCDPETDCGMGGGAFALINGAGDVDERAEEILGLLRTLPVDDIPDAMALRGVKVMMNVDRNLVQVLGCGGVYAQVQRSFSPRRTAP